MPLASAAGSNPNPHFNLRFDSRKVTRSNPLRSHLRRPSPSRTILPMILKSRPAIHSLVAIASALFVFVALIAVQAAPTTGKPNFLIFLADDMGFSDPGCYGGEISTPNL